MFRAICVRVLIEGEQGLHHWLVVVREVVRYAFPLPNVDTEEGGENIIWRKSRALYRPQEAPGSLDTRPE